MNTIIFKKIGFLSVITAGIAATAMVLGILSVSFARYDQPGIFMDKTTKQLPVESNFAVRADVGDVDGDGDLDVVVAPGSHTAVSYLPPPSNFLLQINDSKGCFVNEAVSRLPASAFGTKFASASVLGDVDGDFDLDIFVTNGVSGFRPENLGVFQNRLWINDGAGVFTDETIARLPVSLASSFHAAFGDVDRDGDIDIVVGNVGLYGFGQQNSILINDGSGKFTDETATRLPTLSDITLALALEDLDGDSDLDVVVANRNSNGSKILINNSSGVFTDESSVRLNAHLQHGDVRVANLDGNGSPDIIFASLSGGPRVFINDGSGVFTDETLARTPTFFNAHGITLGDVDLDGDVDVFVVVPGSLSRLLLNDGAGFFNDFTETNLPVILDTIRFPVCGDVDLDGDPDLYLPVSFNDQTAHQDRLLINQGGPVIFIDVPPGYWAEEAIYKIYNAGITKGCSQNPLKYCPNNTVTRTQMAVFLGRGIHGKCFTPPTASGIFADVPVSYWAADWIEQFYRDGITGGCSTNPPRYCPYNPVTRAQMAIFLLRSKHGSSYTPPAATGIFEDVPVTYWVADWIEQLYKEGITVGCGKNPLRYCPENSATRAQMAVFIVRTFGL
jgi:FG-GAP-like repeat